ncbi:MAG: acetyl-CoA carboxylase biotin carboxyl carrier protein [Deltaproteobacteria bacterium]|nr:acetyl-CoA carboxylase biotin carboxyl carrier protein [Deltaproteobacteria bacterium]
MDTDKLREIVTILEGTEVSLVEWRNGEERWTIRRGPEGATTVMGMPTQMMAPPAPAAAAPVAGAPVAAIVEGHVITSPFVGTFYRAPSPESSPFCGVGEKVSKGQTLCIVEAMKLMNEIECDVSGKVLEILVENGQPVEFGEALFVIDPA